VQLSDLTAEPYNLEMGYKIYIKVQAINAYGESENSDPGMNDGIELIPDAPINLTNHPEITNDSQIGISWSDGPSDGDSPILDYRITYDQSTGQYVTLVEGLTDKSYTT
jgi:hypothetical protein